MAPLRWASRGSRWLGHLVVGVVRFAVLVAAGIAAVFSLLVVLDAMLLRGVRRPPRA